MIKTFRGLLQDQTEDRLRLSTIKGMVGYKIVKFQISANTPGSEEAEFVVNIWKTSQSSIGGSIDFTNGDLLATSYLATSTSPATSGAIGPIIFDNQIINQDIYVTNFDASTGQAANYYIELEVINLSAEGAEYTTLKDIRTASTSTII